MQMLTPQIESNNTDQQRVFNKCADISFKNAHGTDVRKQKTVSIFYRNHVYCSNIFIFLEVVTWHFKAKQANKQKKTGNSKTF